MDKLSVIFVRRPWWNPVAAIIRWALPVSRFKWARSSHCMVLVDNSTVIHATMLNGVIEQPFSEALRGYSVIEQCDFEVPDAKAGIDFLRSQVGKPYDFFGALGLSLKPDRLWQEEDSWFCFELAAAAIHKAGRSIFKSTGHVTDTTMLLLRTEKW